MAKISLTFMQAQNKPIKRKKERNTMITRYDFYISFIRDSMREKDIPFNRTLWNDTIDAMVRDESLPKESLNWSYPPNRYFYYR